MSAPRVLAGCFVALVGAAVLGLVVVSGAVALVAGDGGAPAGAGAPAPVAGPVPVVPAPMRSLYLEAAATCPGLPAAVLAAIGTIESGNGTSTLPGVHSGANPAGAEGPMQFEPATFAEYALPAPPGGVVPPSPYDPVDAVYAAARLLCANGAAGGGNLAAGVYAYNHSDSYVADVLALAAALAPEISSGSGTA